MFDVCRGAAGCSVWLPQHGAVQVRSQWKQKSHPTEPTSTARVCRPVLRLVHTQLLTAVQITALPAALGSRLEHSACCFAQGLLMSLTPAGTGSRESPLQGQCSVYPLMFAYSPVMLLSVWIKVLYNYSKCLFQKEK